jgi:RNA polymerase sigma factor (sigma-70 family)
MTEEIVKTENNDFGVKIGADVLYFNPYLRAARVQAGYKSRSDLCRVTGITLSGYCEYERLRTYPVRPKIVAALETHLFRTYDQLFPKEIRDAIDMGAGRWRRLELVREVPIQSLSYDEAPELSYTIDIDSPTLDEQLTEVLHTLPDRGRYVLEHRFGLNGGQVQTLQKIADDLKITKERVRQIEAKALRKMRHPTRSDLLREYTNE